MKSLIYIFLLISFFAKAQHSLTIEVQEIQSSDGFIAVGVYNEEDTFLKDGKTFTGVFEPSKEGTTKITIANLPQVIYAISIFHDMNGNKELDTNFIGIPKEPVAFSKAKMRTFGPPDFEACSFKLTSDFEINIPFE